VGSNPASPTTCTHKGQSRPISPGSDESFHPQRQRQLRLVDRRVKLTIAEFVNDDETVLLLRSTASTSPRASTPAGLIPLDEIITAEVLAA
jgi:hypothetical protein